MLIRKIDWQGLLDGFFTERRNMPFSYGSQDCALFACDAIQVMTAVDIAHEFRGEYRTRKSAMEAARRITGKPTIRAIVEHVTGNFTMPTIQTTMLQRGDVALIQRGTRDHSLGIVSLTGRMLIVPVKDGTTEVPLSLALTGWRV